MAQPLDYLQGDRRRRPPAPTSTSASTPSIAGFEIFESDLGNDIAGADTQGRAHHRRGPRHRRHRRAAQRRADRDLAGQRRRALQPARPTRAGKPLDADFRGWGRGRLRLRDRRSTPSTPSSPGRVPGRGRPADGAAHQLLDRGARHQHRPATRGCISPTRPTANAADPVLNLIEQDGRRATLIAKRERARRQAGLHASTSACRARARRCSSTYSAHRALRRGRWRPIAWLASPPGRTRRQPLPG